jgi:hypothetical protein
MSTFNTDKFIFFYGEKHAIYSSSVDADFETYETSNVETTVSFNCEMFVLAS